MPALVGLLFTLAAALLFRSAYMSVRTWITVSGTVIGYAETQQGRYYDPKGNVDRQTWTAKSAPPPSKLIGYQPQVEFTAHDGKKIVFTSSHGSDKKPYEIGTAISVLYNPQKPEEARIRSFSELFGTPLILMFCGIICFALFLCSV